MVVPSRQQTSNVCAKGRQKAEINSWEARKLESWQVRKEANRVAGKPGSWGAGKRGRRVCPKGHVANAGIKAEVRRS